MKKILIVASMVMLVLCMSVCFASGGTTTSSGMDGFVGELTSGLSADNIWGAILPIAGLIIVACIVGITRRLINKNLSSLTKGKAGKAN